MDRRRQPKVGRGPELSLKLSSGRPEHEVASRAFEAESNERSKKSVSEIRLGDWLGD
jgi:hypothetical protein